MDHVGPPGSPGWGRTKKLRPHLRVFGTCQFQLKLMFSSLLTWVSCSNSLGFALCDPMSTSMLLKSGIFIHVTN